LELINAGSIESAHDCSEGGLAVCVAESCFVSNIGVELSLSGHSPIEIALFGEEASRILVSCDPAKTQHIKEVAGQNGINAELLGKTNATQGLIISRNGKTLVSVKVVELKKVWDQALQIALHSETPEHLVPEVLQKS